MSRPFCKCLIMCTYASEDFVSHHLTLCNGINNYLVLHSTSSNAIYLSIFCSIFNRFGFLAVHFASHWRFDNFITVSHPTPNLAADLEGYSALYLMATLAPPLTFWDQVEPPSCEQEGRSFHSCYSKQLKADLLPGTFVVLAATANAHGSGEVVARVKKNVKRIIQVYLL